MTITVFINTWGRYNQGLQGAWVDLGEQDNEDLEEFLKSKVRDTDPEYFIQDTNTSVEGIEEQTDFFFLNETLYDLGDDIDEEYFVAVAEVDGFQTALNEITSQYPFDKYSFFEADNNENLGLAIVEEGLFGDIPSHLESYIDYEAIGRDWSASFASNGLAVCSN